MVVPPDIINDESSGDVMVPEGGVVKLTCKARGIPEPRITWRREDGGDIIVKEAGPQGAKIRSKFLTPASPLFDFAHLKEKLRTPEKNPVFIKQ